MNEEVQFYLDEAKERMEAALSHLESELSKIRAGRANPKILQDVLVDYYGSPTPLSQVANISTPDPRTIAVQPWEKSMISPIERAIMNANLGLNPDNNGEIIRIILWEDTRKARSARDPALRRSPPAGRWSEALPACSDGWTWSW